MDITRIGNEAMKISLCTTEAQELGFGDKQSEEKMKESFLKLLLRAKEEIEYAVLDKKITGDIFTGKDGGCEIFVSRVEAQERVYKDKATREVAYRAKQVSSIFAFDGLEKLLACAKRLTDVSYEGGSPVYYDESKGKYYIILDDVSIKDIKYAVLSGLVLGTISEIVNADKGILIISLTSPKLTLI